MRDEEGAFHAFILIGPSLTENLDGQATFLGRIHHSLRRSRGSLPVAPLHSLGPTQSHTQSGVKFQLDGQRAHLSLARRSLATRDGQRPVYRAIHGDAKARALA